MWATKKETVGNIENIRYMYQAEIKLEKLEDNKTVTDPAALLCSHCMGNFVVLNSSDKH